MQPLVTQNNTVRPEWPIYYFKIIAALIAAEQQPQGDTNASPGNKESNGEGEALRNRSESPPPPFSPFGERTRGLSSMQVCLPQIHHSVEQQQQQQLCRFIMIALRSAAPLLLCCECKEEALLMDAAAPRVHYTFSQSHTFPVSLRRSLASSYIVHSLMTV